MIEDAGVVIKNMPDTEYRLRIMLCNSYSGAKAYIDDGELSDCRVFPFIDFLRDTPDEIQKKILERNLKMLSLQLFMAIQVSFGTLRNLTM